MHIFAHLLSYPLPTLVLPLLLICKFSVLFADFFDTQLGLAEDGSCTRTRVQICFHGCLLLCLSHSHNIPWSQVVSHPLSIHLMLSGSHTLSLRCLTLVKQLNYRAIFYCRILLITAPPPLPPVLLQFVVRGCRLTAPACGSPRALQPSSSVRASSLSTIFFQPC